VILSDSYTSCSDRSVAKSVYGVHPTTGVSLSIEKSPAGLVYRLKLRNSIFVAVLLRTDHNTDVSEILD